MSNKFLQHLNISWRESANIPRILGPEKPVIYGNYGPINYHLNDVPNLLKERHKIDIHHPSGLWSRVQRSPDNNDYYIVVTGHFRKIYISTSSWDGFSIHDNAYVSETVNFDNFIHNIGAPLKEKLSVLIKNEPDIRDNFTISNIPSHALRQTLELLNNFDHVEFENDRNNFTLLPFARRVTRFIDHAVKGHEVKVLQAFLVASGLAIAGIGIDQHLNPKQTDPQKPVCKYERLPFGFGSVNCQPQ